MDGISLENVLEAIHQEKFVVLTSGGEKVVLEKNPQILNHYLYTISYSGGYLQLVLPYGCKINN